MKKMIVIFFHQKNVFSLFCHFFVIFYGKLYTFVSFNDTMSVMETKNNYLSESPGGVKKRTNLTLSEVCYQFVFCSRYRRKIFVEFEGDQIATRFEEVLTRVCQEQSLELEAWSHESDYVYLKVKAPPTLSPADIMAKIKTQSSKELRQHILGLQHLQGLWTRAYLVTTEAVLTSEKIEGFLAQQKTRS